MDIDEGLAFADAAMTRRSVVIAGGGPTGLMLGAELALAGIDVEVVERRTIPFPGSRAGGLHSRTIEMLDQRGVADRFLAEGRAMQVQAYAMIPLDISDFPTRHNYGLALWQSHFERILAGWVDELGVPVLRGCEVVAFTQDDTGVDVQLSDGERRRAAFLVGCDGGRSLVRKEAGIEFAGWDPTRSALIAELSMSEETPRGVLRDEVGVYGIHRMEDGETVRVLITEPAVGAGEEPTFDELRRALVAVWGTDFGAHSPTSLSRFTDMTRQATSYRAGRVLLAGDAAHVHYPVGGQGLNIGIQDAVNLGWKLAQVVKGTSGDDLLDTYHAERHPVGARVLQNTMAQTALMRSDPRADALRDAMTELLAMDEPRKRYGGMISGLDVHYDLGEAHPLVGWRMPDLELQTPRGVVRVFELLHDARPLLLELAGVGGVRDGEPGVFDASPWVDRIRLVSATCEGPWELPVLGNVGAPRGVLVRPDGHVAWAGELSDPALLTTAGRWFGTARA